MATRTERVVLELESNISSQLVKDAAAVALLKRELSGLDGSTKGASTSTRTLTHDTSGLANQAVKGRAEIDRFSGRLTVLAQVAAGLGPALAPIGAIGIPAVGGLANELAAVGLAGGTALLAFHNIGSTLDALNKATLEPTDTNLQNARIALSELPPAARAFAQELHNLAPTILRLRAVAGDGLFPGLTDSLDELRGRTHEVEKILFRVGSVLGNFSRQGAEALAGPEWDEFFKFISIEAPRALVGLGKATGSVVHGLAELWMAFAPLNNDFTGLIVSAADGFDRWASGLAKTEGFTDFIAYLRTNGPLVADAVVSIGNAVLKIVEAAAPLGGPILQALTAVANAVALIADSPAGPTILATVTALSLLSRAQSTFGRISAASWVQAVRGADTFQAKVTAIRGPAIKGGLAIAGIGLAASGVSDKFDLANTATLALTGSLAGPWGAAAGGAVGLLLDMSKGNEEFKVSTEDITDTLNKQTGAITKNTKAFIASQFQQQGVFDAATRIGANLTDVTNAALGNEDALRRVTDATKAYQAAVSTPQVVGQDIHGNDVLVAPPVSEADKDAVDKLNGALGTTSDAVRDAKGNLIELNSAIGGTSHSFKSAKSTAQLFREEIARVNSTLTGRSNLRDYQAALDDFTKSVKDNGKTLDINTEKGRANQAALDAIASSALAVSQNLKGADRADFLAQARKDFLASAHEIGLSDKAAKNLADRLGLLSRIKAHAKVYVDGIPKSLADLEAVAAHLRALHDKTIKLTTVRTTGGRVLPGLAGGGTVPGPRAPYGDKVLAALAPGEFVVSNRHGQADAHRDLLRAINTRRYADGGTVAASRVSVNVAGASNVAGSPIDYGRLAQAVAAVRPAPALYGDVHVTDGYGGFKRQMDQDQAMAALSGVGR